MTKEVILVSTDGTDLSRRAIKTALRLAKDLGLPLVGMTAVVSDPDAGIVDLDSQPETVRATMHEVAELAEPTGVDYQLVVEHCLEPWEGILDVAQRYNARYIVMGSRGLGSLGSLILGSETQKVLSAATRPVLVVR
ncbi:MAG: universal stress protein [Duodenibacillus sp.]|nr:universal stress protein [Duodenibacillus sp.]